MSNVKKLISIFLLLLLLLFDKEKYVLMKKVCDYENLQFYF